MKVPGVVFLIAALPALCLPPPTSAAPGTLDATRRNGTFAPQRNIETETRTPEGNRSFQDKRAEPGALIERKEAAAGGKMAPFATSEAREKKLFRAPGKREFATLPRAEASVNGKRAASRAGDRVVGKKNARQQESLSSAYRLGGREPPRVEKSKVSKSDLNRFVFRKNSPDGGEWTAKAGGDAAPRPADGTAELRVMGIAP